VVVKISPEAKKQQKWEPTNSYLKSATSNYNAT
jgi:hypothetical protein